MSKIRSIRINNFKFFGETDPIMLEGKNWLLYGENGSGKSSVYNAIYTLFEAASKTPDGVKKYFKPLSAENTQSLVNIHAPLDANGSVDSYIEVTDTRDNVYRISYNDTNLCGNLPFQEAQRASGFINYQSLFRFQLFRNSEESNLHDVFKHAIIPYLSCPAYEYMGDTITTVSDLFKAYLNQDALKVDNPKGKKVIYKRSDLYKKFLKLEKKINDELRGVIEYVNEQLPTILGMLGYSFGAYLRYEEQGHKKYDRWIEYFPFAVFLEIDEYEGKRFDEAPIKHPNVFLNEAKMSALAFAIRWAILTKPAGDALTPDALRVLALDDIMISLDMSNREKLIDLLLSDATIPYQLLFFTHDRNLYTFISHKINNHSNWIKMEMYVGEKDGREYPVIIDGECDSLSKAQKYYEAKDYIVSALYIRKSIEEYIQQYLPDEYCKNPDGRFVELNTLWKRFLQYANQVPQSIKDSFDQSRLLVLNPSVHYQRLSWPIYRSELLKAFKLVEELKALAPNVKTLLIAKNTKLIFKHPTENYTLEFVIKEDMIRGRNENPQCHINTWQYNGIELHDFRTGEAGDPPRVPDTRLRRLIENIESIAQLGITKEMFENYSYLDSGTLREAIS